LPRQDGEVGPYRAPECGALTSGARAKTLDPKRSKTPAASDYAGVSPSDELRLPKQDPSCLPHVTLGWRLRSPRKEKALTTGGKWSGSLFRQMCSWSGAREDAHPACRNNAGARKAEHPCPSAVPHLGRNRGPEGTGNPSLRPLLSSAARSACCRFAAH
jgi:hypothetical protein